MPVLLLLLFTLGNTLNYLDRYLLPAVLPLVMQSFSLSNERAGVLVAAFVFGYSLASPVFGFFGDRWNRPRLMALGILTWSAATLWCSYAAGFTSMLLARLVMGVGQACFATIAPAYIKDRVADPEKINKTFSAFFAAVPIGSALAYIVTGYVVKGSAWANVFIAGALPGLMIFWVFMRCREVRPQAPKRIPLISGLRQIMTTPVLQFTIGGYVLNAFALNGIASFLTKYGETIGFTVDQISKYFGIILVLTGFVGTISGGWLAGRAAHKQHNKITAMLRFVAVTALLGVPIIVLAFIIRDHKAFLALCFLSEFFIFAGVAPLNSVIVLSCPQHLVTLTQGVTILALNLIGAFPAPILIGWIADRYSLAAGMQISSAALLCSAALWFIAAKKSAALPIAERH